MTNDRPVAGQRSCSCGDPAGLLSRALAGHANVVCDAHRPASPDRGPTTALNDDPALIGAIETALGMTNKETRNA